MISGRSVTVVMGYADMIESLPETEPEVRKKAALIRSRVSGSATRSRTFNLRTLTWLQAGIQYAALRLNPISWLQFCAGWRPILNTIERPQDYRFPLRDFQEFEEYTMMG